MNILISEFAYEGRGYVNASPIQLLTAGVPEALVLDAVKPILKAAVDARAEAVRLSLITGGVGQSMEYAEADAQAREALAAAPGAATAERYAMLAASIGIDIDPQTGKPATDVLGVARSVLTARDGWLAAGAAIRKARLTAKAAIDGASTFAEAASAVASVSWPSL